MTPYKLQLLAQALREKARVRQEKLAEPGGADALRQAYRQAPKAFRPRWPLWVLVDEAMGRRLRVLKRPTLPPGPNNLEGLAEAIRQARALYLAGQCESGDT